MEKECKGYLHTDTYNAATLLVLFIYCSTFFLILRGIKEASVQE